MNTTENGKTKLRTTRNEMLKGIRSVTRGQLQWLRCGKISEFIEGLGEKERHYEELTHVLESIGKTAETSTTEQDNNLLQLDAHASEMISEIRALEEKIQQELEDRLERVQQEIRTIRSGREALSAYSVKGVRSTGSLTRRG